MGPCIWVAGVDRRISWKYFLRLLHLRLSSANMGGVPHLLHLRLHRRTPAMATSALPNQCTPATMAISASATATVVLMLSGDCWLELPRLLQHRRAFSSARRRPPQLLQVLRWRPPQVLRLLRGRPPQLLQPLRRRPPQLLQLLRPPKTARHQARFLPQIVLGGSAVGTSRIRPRCRRNCATRKPKTV